MLTKKLDPPLDTTLRKVLLTFKAVRPPHHHTMIHDPYYPFQSSEQEETYWIEQNILADQELARLYAWQEQEKARQTKIEQEAKDRLFLDESLGIAIKDIPLYSSSVYVLALKRDPLLFKIGYTTQPRRRAKAIARKHKSQICYYALSSSTPEARQIEEELHHLYYRRRERFNDEIEWHRLTSQDLTVIHRYFAAIATGEEF